MDVSIAMAHLILAARAEGLGTRWIEDFQNNAVKNVLDLPKDENVIAVTPFGYPDKGIFSEVTNRKPLGKIIQEV